MKNFLITIILLGSLAFTFLYRDEIVDQLFKNYIYKKEVVYKAPNEYKRNYNFLFVSETENFIVENEQDIKNVFYSILNNGWDSYTFYCADYYSNCIIDIQKISDDNFILSNINSFVHPFNSYSNLSISYNNFGKIDISLTKLYSESEILAVNQEADRILNEVVDEKMTNKQKIKTLHDYIINTTSYDKERADLIDQGITEYDFTYKSNKAIGPLIEKMAICSGYADAMAIFLNRLNIPNYKVSSNTHVWNYLYLDNNWYHLDLTWDDPVVNGGTKNILIYDYFLITSDELKKLDQTEHVFDNNIFMEG